MSIQGARVPLGIAVPSISGPKTCVELAPESEDSSPVLTWILRYLWSLHMGVIPPLEWGHARPLSSQAVATVLHFHRVDTGSCGFPWGLSLGAFPRGFTTGLSHLPPWCESILGMQVEAVQGKQVPLEWTETCGGLLEWWHDPRFPLVSPVESASPRDAKGTLGILSRRSRERIPHLELRGGNGALLDVGGTLVLPLVWRLVC